MNRIVAIAGMALFMACLIGWAALASAPPADKTTSADYLPVGAGSADSEKEITPSGEMPIRPRLAGSTATPPLAPFTYPAAGAPPRPPPRRRRGGGDPGGG